MLVVLVAANEAGGIGVDEAKMPGNTWGDTFVGVIAVLDSERGGSVL